MGALSVVVARAAERTAVETEVTVAKVAYWGDAGVEDTMVAWVMGAEVTALAVMEREVAAVAVVAAEKVAGERVAEEKVVVARVEVPKVMVEVEVRAQARGKVVRTEATWVVA